MRFPIIDHASQSCITRNAFSQYQEFSREYEIPRLCSSSGTWQTISGEKYSARFVANRSLECKLVALLRTRLVGARMSFFCGRRLEHFAFAHNLVVEAGLIKSVERFSPTVLPKSNVPVVTLSERFP